MIYSLVPIFPFYALSTNKDMFFSLLMLLYIIKIYELIKYENYDFKNWISLIIISTFLFLSRNNGIYTIFLSLPIAFFILKDKRKYIFSSIMVITLFYIGYNKVILPHFEITSTSVREMLSIPFQQTANLIVKDEKLISVHDKKIISQILDYDVIKKAYDPELADHVKNTFNKNSTDDDLNAYFKVWIKYLFLKPSIYMNATINNVYGYFYPDTNRWYLYYTYNKKLAEAGFDYHFNNFKTLRNVLSGYGQAFQYIPVLNVFVNIGLSVWIYLYLVVILLVDKNKKMILLLTPALSLILVCVASPANAYFRYALPYILSLPLVVALLYKNTKKTYD